MTACGDKHRMLARLADGSGADAPTAEDQAELDAHLAECAACRSALDEQRLVANVLRSRPALVPSAAFSRRLASRLDEASGWLGILDWRTWTFRLAPVAAALAIAALLAGTSSTSEGFDDNARCLDARRRRAFVGGVRRVAGGHKLGCAHRDDVDRRGRRHQGDERCSIAGHASGSPFSFWRCSASASPPVSCSAVVWLDRPDVRLVTSRALPGPVSAEAVRRRGFSSTGSIANCPSRTSSAPASGPSSRRAASASINSSRTRTTAWRTSSATCENRFVAS